jgi:hypothetical protein
VVLLGGVGERVGVLDVEEVGVGAAAVGEEGCYGVVVASCRGPVQGVAACGVGVVYGGGVFGEGLG